jgi:hypothetical protein
VAAFSHGTMPVPAVERNVIDRAIHDCSHGYVYVRAVDVEPAPFYNVADVKCAPRSGRAFRRGSRAPREAAADSAWCA